MQLLDLTLETPEENLALDEALLDVAEQSGKPCESLRLWESPTPLLVLGRSSKVGEVNLVACQQLGVPVLRRVSGGATIVAGPGCLMYSLVLSSEQMPELKAIDVAHVYVLERIARALRPVCPGIVRQGTSDLTLNHRKFSGNSMRARRDRLLYHGTLLYDFPLPLIEQCLGTPPRQPAYRAGRTHGDFVMNLPLTPQALRQILVKAWQADEPMPDWPAELVRQTVAARYSRPLWNLEGKAELP